MFRGIRIGREVRSSCCYDIVSTITLETFKLHKSCHCINSNTCRNQTMFALLFPYVYLHFICRYFEVQYKLGKCKSIIIILPLFSALDTQNCFEGCSSSPSSDANGNTGNGLEKAKFGDGEPASVPEETEVTCIEKSIEKEKLASIAAERERLVTSPAEKSEMVLKFVLHFSL